MEKARATTRFRGLDGLRGVCALTVVLMHSELLFNAGVIFCHGYLAVDMFFILSGFVISASYDARLGTGLTAWGFLQARVRRLAPVFWAGSLLCITAMLICNQYEFVLAPANLALFAALVIFLIPYPVAAANAYPINPVAWSLLWELMVNFLYAWLLRRLSTLLLAVLIGAMLFLALLVSFHSEQAWSFGVKGGEIWLGGLRALPEFLMGVVLHRAYRAGHFARVPVVTPLLPLTAWLAIAVLPPGLPPLVDILVVTLACPLLIAALIRGEEGAPGWFTPLGAISYPLYTSHFGLIWLAQHTPLFGLDNGPRPGLAAGMVVLAMGLAWILYRLFDPAARKLPKEALLSAFPPKRRNPGACETTPESL